MELGPCVLSTGTKRLEGLKMGVLYPACSLELCGDQKARVHARPVI